MTTERSNAKYWGWFIVLLLGALWFKLDPTDITEDPLLQLRIGVAAGLVAAPILFLAMRLLSFRQEMGLLRRLGEALVIAISFALIWVLGGWADYQAKWAIRGGHTWIIVLTLAIPLLLLLAVFILDRRSRAFQSGNSHAGKSSSVTTRDEH